jgi:capping protein alpha
LLGFYLCSSLFSSFLGQFNEILSDLNKIIPSSLLSNEFIAKVARAYHIKNGRTVTNSNGKRFILSIHGEIDSSHYFDPNNGSIIHYDYVTSTVSDSSDESIVSNQDSSLEMIRSGFQNAISNYVSTKYHCEESAGSVYATNGKIYVVIYGEKTNLRNFWSGKWFSTWTLSMSGPNSAAILGDVKLHAHYFEDGNLQLNNSKVVAEKVINGSSDVDFVSNIIAHISASENSIQQGLEAMYNNMNEETLKAMRRIMPITKTKMEWNVNSVRMVKQVRK